MMEKTMQGIFRSAILTSFTLAVSSAALGSTIDFATLTGANSDPVATYTENGFIVSSTAGSWFKAFLYGNSTPDIFLGPVGAPLPGSITIGDGGSLFTFSSIDFSSNNAGSGYTITGFKGGVQQFVESGTEAISGSVFTTLASSSALSVDSLVISLTPGVGTTSFNVDNIVVSTASTPEPATLGLLGLGGLTAAFFVRERIGRA
jgi:hypothetical protein